MLTRNSRLVGAAVGLSVGVAVIAAPAPADTVAAAGKTFEVTSASCTGAGSLVKAVEDANKNPGRDTIRFKPGLVVYVQLCPPAQGGPSYQPGSWFFAKVTESVTFEGNGAKLAGLIRWIDPNGNFNPSVCPDSNKQTLRVANTPGFLEVGRSGVDNSGIDVVVRDLKMDQVSAVARARDGSSLELDGITATRIFSHDKNCQTAAVELDDNSTGRVLNSTFALVTNAQTQSTRAATGIIAGGLAKHLYVLNSKFQGSSAGYAIYWLGKDANATANIVSSQFDDAQGIGAFIGRVNVVNSAIAFSNAVGTKDRVTTAGGPSAMTLRASTVSTPFAVCKTIACKDERLMGTPITAVGGPISLQETAVGVTFPQEPNSYVVNSSDTDPVNYFAKVSADKYTWITPTSEQDPARLQAVTHQPDLLTGFPGLTNNAFVDFVQKVTPVLYSQKPPAPPVPGVLLDVIPDAAAGQANELKDPETGQVITKDVFGSPRVDGNGRRNVGAVQLTLAPQLQVVNIKKTSLTPAWTRPADPASGPITGYGVFYRAVGGGSYTRIDVTGPDQWRQVVSGLTPDTEYEFYVVAVNKVGDGPPSSVVRASTLMDPHLDYPVGKGQVDVRLDPMKPHFFDVIAPRKYSVTSGKLPKGLTLDANSGVISGTPREAGRTNLQITVVGSRGTAVADVRIDVTARPVAPHLSYPAGQGEQGKKIAPLTPQTDGLSGSLRYEVVRGELPKGLQLDPGTGVVSGTPQAYGKFVVTVRVTGADGSTTAPVEIDVRPSATPYLHYETVAGHVDTALKPRKPQVSGLTGTVSFALTKGSLPKGVQLDPGTGAFVGTPTAKTDRKVQVTVTGANGSATDTVRVLVSRPATPLTVDARGLSPRLPVGQPTKVVRKVTTPGTVRVKTTCWIGGRADKSYCGVRVTKNHQVFVTPKCLLASQLMAADPRQAAGEVVGPPCARGMSVWVRIEAKTPGKETTIWERGWRVQRRG